MRMFINSRSNIIFPDTQVLWFYDLLRHQGHECHVNILRPYTLITFDPPFYYITDYYIRCKRGSMEALPLL